MNDAQKLTDRSALGRNRMRAARSERPAFFLHDVAIDEVHETLSLVNKSFESRALVSGHTQHWARAFPDFELVADSETLPLVQEGKDLLIHAMALHWANDPVGQLVQARHALKPDGLFIAVAFGGKTLSELRSSLAQAETEVTGGGAPRVLPMGDVRDYGNLLQRAGFSMPVSGVVEQNVRYRDIMHLMHDIRSMGEANALNRRHKAPIRRDVLIRTQEIYTDHFSTNDGGISATFELIVLSGWAPDESQPKPLRPGSATARLSDALGAVEGKLRDE